MDRETYIQNLNKGELTIPSYYKFFELGNGKLGYNEFMKLFPGFYRIQNPVFQSTINNRVIMVLDNHYLVNLVYDRQGNVLKRY